MKKLLGTLSALLGGVFLLSAADIYLAGDSQIGKFKEKQLPRTGWGDALPALCADSVKVYNFGVPGSSTLSFQKRWGKMIAKVQKGDFVVIQFGFFDGSKSKKGAAKYTDPASTYRENLRGFIKAVRAAGATPVLVSPLPLCRYDKRGKLYAKAQEKNNLAAYAEAVKAVAAEEKVDFVDLFSIGLRKLSGMDQQEGQKLYFKTGPELLKEGAEQYAAWFAEDAKRQKLPVAGCFR